VISEWLTERLSNPQVMFCELSITKSFAHRWIESAAVAPLGLAWAN
jgi:hypothetical protein